MTDEDETEVLIAQLQDPSRSNQALMGLLSRGREIVPALIEYLRTTKPSTVAEGRRLAVEGLSTLKGEEALDGLIEVATERLGEIPNPAVRLAEESVVSAAALALADFPQPRARQALLSLLQRQPLSGTAEAFEKLKDPRAVPVLVSWLEDDFVAETAARAILAIGQSAIPWLLMSLRRKNYIHESETGSSQRRRARILEILEALAGNDVAAVFDQHLNDPVQAVRWQAILSLARHGTGEQKQRALRGALQLLDARDGSLRTDASELLASNFEMCTDLIEEEIRRRRENGEREQALTPQETPLEILLRIHRQGAKPMEAAPS